MAICPYIQNFSVTEQENLLDEENQEYIGKHIIKQMWTNMECKKEDCAVYKDGVCHYNGQLCK